MNQKGKVSAPNVDFVGCALTYFDYGPIFHRATIFQVVES